MIALPVGTRVWLAAGVTDMRKGMDGLAALVQTTLAENPFSGQLFVFRGRCGDLVKLLWFDGDGLCLLAKRLERGRFVCLRATSRVAPPTTTPIRFAPAAIFAYHRVWNAVTARSSMMYLRIRHGI